MRNSRSRFCFVLFGVIICYLTYANYIVKMSKSGSDYSGDSLDPIFEHLSPDMCPHSKINQSVSVTRIVHQTWRSRPVPQKFQPWSKSWQRCFPDWRHKMWTDKENRRLVKRHYNWLLSRYDSYGRGVYRADLVRYLYMHRYGGLYTDIDNECLRPFEHLLANYSLVFGAMEGNFGSYNQREGYVQNSFLYSQPRHPLWMWLVREIMNRPIDVEPEESTGSLPLNKVLIHLKKATKGSQTCLRIYPPLFFNPFSWKPTTTIDPHCKTKGAMTKYEWKECRRAMLNKGAYVVQYHAHTW